MRKRANGSESSSTAHKRHAAATLDEILLPPATSSLGHASSSSIPKIPLDLIADLILPFVADRATWNSVYGASKYLCLAGKKMTPPWPDKTFNNFANNGVRHIVFSPSGSQLVFGSNMVHTRQPVAHVWDRWGKETILGVLARRILCLEYSSDGKYLASGCHDRLIRLWHTEYFHAASSNISREIPTRAPKQADIVLVGSRSAATLTLSFSRTDSNLLASGGSNGEIKVWNVKEQACIHSDNPGGRYIRSLFFTGGADIACIAVAHTGSILRLWRAEDSSDLASEIIGKTADPAVEKIDQAVFSRCGSFLATRGYSIEENGNMSTVALYELETMTKTQSVVMPSIRKSTFLAVSPDSRQLVFGDYGGWGRFVETEDFSIQRELDPRGRSSSTLVVSVAFDPTCRVLAVGGLDNTLELRTL